MELECNCLKLRRTVAVAAAGVERAGTVALEFERSETSVEDSLAAAVPEGQLVRSAVVVADKSADVPFAVDSFAVRALGLAPAFSLRSGTVVEHTFAVAECKSAVEACSSDCRRSFVEDELRLS